MPCSITRNDNFYTRCVAAFKPDSSLDLCALELAEFRIRSMGWKFVWLSPEPGVSPLWLHAKLKSEGVTDMVAVNRFRSSLEGHLPSEIRCHTLVTSLPPEWLGAPQHILPHDSVSLMNSYAQGEAGTMMNASPTTWPSASWAVPLSKKDIHIICIADHPSGAFTRALETHPTLGPLMLRVLRALNESPAFLSRDQLDLIMALAERATGTRILNPHQRERLLSLIQAHVLGPQNTRKALLDLVRHNPGIPAIIVGCGWHLEPELAGYARPTPGSGELSRLLARSRVLLVPHAIESMFPGPELAAAASARACPLLAHPEAAKLPPWLWGMPKAHNLASLSSRLSELVAQPSASAKVALEFAGAWDEAMKDGVWDPSEAAKGPVRKAT